jgi:hypothetical protein
MILADAVFEVDPVAKELGLRLVDAHHMKDRIVPAPVRFNLFWTKLIWATGPQDAPIQTCTHTIALEILSLDYRVVIHCD